MKQDIEELLEKLRDELGMALGSHLDQVVLYGSRARGDEEPDSDLDVPVVLRESSQSERERIHRVAPSFFKGFQVVISSCRCFHNPRRGGRFSPECFFSDNYFLSALSA